MFKKLFGKSAGGSGVNETIAGGGGSEPLDAIKEMKASLDLLEKREEHLHRLAEQEIKKAKVFLSQKNKKAAMLCMKKKTMYLNNAEQLANHQLNVHTQMTLLETSKTTVEAVKAMDVGTKNIKMIQKAQTIEKVEKLAEDVQEVNDYAKDVNELLATPFGAAADLDEDELNQELDELEALELDEQLLAPAMPSAPGGVPALAQNNSIPAQPTTVNRKKTAEELELEELQAEMALA
mmetsp:Transcript_4014/g.7800  ORF Transcript_4014/g.7800 Transcript_4014/m.7800 type:complete len:236 (-) Transcript_4014:548-1255(-)|eukprot:CAMPEP_0114250230 /NCGR_PEP_ID=MMETSP0058-20121206/14584_1 /TAXON_ID=36894 /ORGANISM="Pyramimonas parkeae, CCMP726" /LENGTH=235 /DNA_ID=CAMNT_0001363867 /DNA_START=302 /DNA_END=1009 /DNA_ORIENTATION=+